MISVSDILIAARRDFLLVVVVTLLVAACGVAGAWTFAKYKSQGFFQFGGPIPVVKEKVKDKDKDKEKDREPGPGIALSDFKRYAASYATSERFNDYIQERKLAAMDGVDDLQQIFSSREGIAKSIGPVYPFTKLDAKELMEQPKDTSNNIIGLRINYEHRAPEIAQKMAGLLGRYAMDSIIYQIYSDALRFKRDEIKTRMIKLDNAIIKSKTELDEYRRRSADLKKIIANNPAAAGQSAQQVVSVTEDSARYLSPVTQLVTSEVQISEANEAILKAAREQQQNALLLDYYERVKTLLENTKSGETLLQSLESQKDAVFKNKNLQDDVVKETFNLITIDNQTAINLYLDKSRFIAGPTLPRYPTVRLGIVLTGSLALGLLLSVLLVSWRQWRREDRTI